MQRAVITARVRIQKVGYRDIVAEIANNMDITGIVENLSDGKSVRIIAEANQYVLEEFIQLLWLKDEPLIKVINVDTTFQPPTGEYEFFDIIYEDFQKEAFERIGEAAFYLKSLDTGQTKMLDKQDQMLGKQDQMLDKQDQMLGKQDQMLGKQDQMLGKQDQMLGKQDTTIEKIDETKNGITGEIKGLRNDLKSYMDQKFMKIEYDISQIKEMIGLN
ncbi:MAG: acylphosphatase [ANME-2 cluster archaeon]|nr:acylphosphatase [ANME-2 cluster archaeon]